MPQATKCWGPHVPFFQMDRPRQDPKVHHRQRFDLQRMSSHHSLKACAPDRREGLYGDQLAHKFGTEYRRILLPGHVKPHPCHGAFEIQSPTYCATLPNAAQRQSYVHYG